MQELIQDWLISQKFSESYIQEATVFIGVCFLLILSSIAFYLAKYQVLKGIKAFILKTKNTWDDALIEHGVLTRITLILPYILIWLLTPFFVPESSSVASLLILFAKILLMIQVASSINALLNVTKTMYQEKAKQRYLPLDAIVQIIKLVLYLLTTILVVSLLLNKSPIYLLSGIGALTAVLLLVFQDTIKGLVASIQISANKMVVTGDWIELPNYGANGDVVEIGLSTVKIKNFDKTITTVPTYALISDSFKNWRNMYHTGARRIKRTIIIDMGSIHFYNETDIKKLTQTKLLKGYLTSKKQEVSQPAESFDLTPEEALNLVNKRQLTNIGTFRVYIDNYLHNLDTINTELTCMVRQLPSTPDGLPLEVYCFASTTEWADYEAIQADVFDHLFAVAPHFGLRVFQHPSGYDWHKGV
jgi:miniconductance mechanosensitive channel